MAFYSKNDKKYKRKNYKNDKIVMTGPKTAQKSDDKKLKVVNGKRMKIKLKKLITFTVVLALILTVFIINVLTPTGIIESIQNSFAGYGISNEKNITLFDKSCVDVKCNDDAIFSLSQSYLEVYSSGGKSILLNQHGFTKPTLALSEARALVFDRGKTGYKVYNYTGMLFDGKTEKNILAGDISRSGYFALATYSDSYTAQVSVFNKNFENVYTWYSADKLVSDVALSRDGKRVAISTVFAQNGALKSEILLFKYNSASPYYSLSVDGPITNLSQMNSKVFSASGEHFVFCISWNGSSKNDLVLNKEIKFVASNDNGLLATVVGADNTQQNTVQLFNKPQEILHTFTVDASIEHIALTDKNFYCVVDGKIECYDLEGKLTDVVTPLKPTKFISGLSSQKIVSVSDGHLEIISDIVFENNN